MEKKQKTDSNSILEEKFITLREFLSYMGVVIALVIGFGTWSTLKIFELSENVAVLESNQSNTKNELEKFFGYHKQQMESLYNDLKETTINIKKIETILDERSKQK